ncbi:hypothetical protein B0T25DRAFT_6954 [Lasiosphaeria hispida]|uniref:Uncharacterized protein n=1 Tax=Lasiosphaeria hispida TaxID=260671 RepID=A0AAJ0HTH3_9PEZI|nr:hypothetical protein B0T25DRAFT_6954 [Lasiosphaeria hispida]
MRKSMSCSRSTSQARAGVEFSDGGRARCCRVCRRKSTSVERMQSAGKVLMQEDCWRDRVKIWDTRKLRSLWLRATEPRHGLLAVLAIGYAGGTLVTGCAVMGGAAGVGELQRPVWWGWRRAAFLFRLFFLVLLRHLVSSSLSSWGAGDLTSRQMTSGQTP